LALEASAIVAMVTLLEMEKRRHMTGRQLVVLGVALLPFASLLALYWVVVLIRLAARELVACVREFGAGIGEWRAELFPRRHAPTIKSDDAFLEAARREVEQIAPDGDA